MYKPSELLAFLASVCRCAHRSPLEIIILNVIPMQRGKTSYRSDVSLTHKRVTWIIPLFLYTNSTKMMLNPSAKIVFLEEERCSSPGFVKWPSWKKKFWKINCKIVLLAPYYLAEIDGVISCKINRRTASVVLKWLWIVCISRKLFRSTDIGRLLMEKTLKNIQFTFF